MKKIRDYVPASVCLIPGKASRYIKPFNIKPGDHVIIVCRVSWDEQARKGHLEKQEAKLRQAVESRGGIVIDVVSLVTTGKNPLWICHVAKMARRHRAVILALATDRFIRNEGFDLIDFPFFQPSEHELDYLSHLANGATLMTLIHPDASPDEVRGERAKGNAGGRPRKPRRAATYLPRCDEATVKRINDLRLSGKSIRQIARLLGYAHTTIQGHIRKCTNLRKGDVRVGGSA